MYLSEQSQEENLNQANQSDQNTNTWDKLKILACELLYLTNLLLTVFSLVELQKIDANAFKFIWIIAIFYTTGYLFTGVELYQFFSNEDHRTVKSVFLSLVFCPFESLSKIFNTIGLIRLSLFILPSFTLSVYANLNFNFLQINLVYVFLLIIDSIFIGLFLLHLVMICGTLLACKNLLSRFSVNATQENQVHRQ